MVPGLCCTSLPLEGFLLATSLHWRLIHITWRNSWSLPSDFKYSQYSDFRLCSKAGLCSKAIFPLHCSLTIGCVFTLGVSARVLFDALEREGQFQSEPKSWQWIGNGERSLVLFWILLSIHFVGPCTC